MIKDTVTFYDYNTGQWFGSESNAALSLSQARYDLTASGAGNYIVVAGGHTALRFSDVVDIFDTRSRTWRTGPRLSRPRGIPASATAADRYVIIAGGLSGLYMPHSCFYFIFVHEFHRFSTPVDTVDIFDCVTQRFVTGNYDLKDARAMLTADGIGNRVIVAGGAYVICCFMFFYLFPFLTFMTVELNLSLMFMMSVVGPFRTGISRALFRRGNPPWSPCQKQHGSLLAVFRTVELCILLLIHLQHWCI